MVDDLSAFERVRTLYRGDRFSFTAEDTLMAFQSLAAEPATDFTSWSIFSIADFAAVRACFFRAASFACASMSLPQGAGVSRPAFYSRLAIFVASASALRISVRARSRAW